MAHLFKPQIVHYVDADGKRVPKATPGARQVREESRKWYAKGRPLPRGKKVPLAADRKEAEALLAELVRQAERGAVDDLLKIIAAWSDLKPSTRASILAMIADGRKMKKKS